MEDALALDTHIGFSIARGGLSGILDRVAEGCLRVIDRRGEESIALVDARMMDQVLAQAFPFKPEVYFDGESGVAVWLPELEVGAEADDLPEAQEQLVEAVLGYAELWEAELKNAPIHAERYGWVFRVQLAARPERIHEVLFDREDANVRSASSVLPR